MRTTRNSQRLKWGWLVIVAAIYGFGCRGGKLSRPDLGSGLQDLQSPNLQAELNDDRPDKSHESDIALTAGEASDEAEASSAEQTPDISPSLPLADAISLALAQNPDLIALRETENVSLAALGVAETYPFNPFLQVQATPYQQDNPDGNNTTYHYVLLMQTIQLAHQQQFREEGAVSVLNTTRWQIHQAELLNVAQTERLYFTTLYLRGIRELAIASDRNNQELLRTLERQLDAGQATAADVAIVRVDTKSTHQQVRLAIANYETALRDLKRQLGLPADHPAKIAGDLTEYTWQLPSWDLLHCHDENLTQLHDPVAQPDTASVVNWASTRPDVLAAHSDIDVARAGLRLATASTVPDFQVGPYYQRTTDGTYFLGFRAQMDLPIMNSGRPLEAQRAAEHNQRVQIWQQTLRRAELEAQAAWERYLVALQAVEDDLTADLKTVPAELQSLERQFLEGEVDVVRVVQARNSIIQNQRTRLDLLNELSQSAANLTAATGIPVASLIK